MPPQDVWKFPRVLQDIGPFGAAALLSNHFITGSLPAGHRVPLTKCDPLMTSFLFFPPLISFPISRPPPRGEGGNSIIYMPVVMFAELGKTIFSMQLMADIHQAMLAF